MTQERSDDHADEHAYQGREQRPSTHHLHIVCQCGLITLLMQFRDASDSTEGKTQVRGLEDHVDGGIEQGCQPHARRSEQKGNQFRTDKTQSDVQSLYTTENARILQNMVVSYILFFHDFVFQTQKYCFYF